MYAITTQNDGIRITVAESIRYIRKGANGCFVSATKDDADGVAVNGVPYALLGKTLDGAVDTVMIQEVDGGKIIAEQAAQLDYIAMMADVDLDVLTVANNESEVDEDE